MEFWSIIWNMNEEQIWKKYHNGELLISDYKITAEPQSEEDTIKRCGPKINIDIKFIQTEAPLQNPLPTDTQ